MLYGLIGFSVLITMCPFVYGLYNADSGERLVVGLVLSALPLPVTVLSIIGAIAHGGPGWFVGFTTGLVLVAVILVLAEKMVE